MKNIIIIALILILSSVGFSQGIARQSINSIGGSYSVGNTLIQSSVGQPYQTQVNDGSTEVRPGFIQSNSMRIENIAEETDIDMTVYPNPAIESFTIQSDEDYEDVSIQVVASTGEVIELINVKDFREHNINCSSWKNGTYFITVLTKDGKRNNSKLIITK